METVFLVILVEIMRNSLTCANRPTTRRRMNTLLRLSRVLSFFYEPASHIGGAPPSKPSPLECFGGIIIRLRITKTTTSITLLCHHGTYTFVSL